MFKLNQHFETEMILQFFILFSNIFVIAILTLLKLINNYCCHYGRYLWCKKVSLD